MKPGTYPSVLPTPLALARIRLANAAAPLRFASGETQGELDFVSAAVQGVRCAQARRKE